MNGKARSQITDSGHVLPQARAQTSRNFKEVGDDVTSGETIGLVEVMKTFHEIKAGADGTIASFQVDDSEPVMAGQVLVELD